ncbi:MAG: START domain-containing protein [Pseudomonadales bacterium]|nr:START domain-containing protein [Pseudomonadales bacterium]
MLAVNNTLETFDIEPPKERLCFDSLPWKKAAQTKGPKGVLVETAQVKGFELRAIRAQSTYDASMWQLRARIMDMSNFPKWVEGVLRAEVIRRNAKHIQACYSEYHAPWPVKNRDGVVVQHAKRVDDNTIQIHLHAQSNLLEERKGIVRVDYLDGCWTLTDLGNGKTKLVYQVHSDPNGNIPDWVVNSRIAEAPTNTLSKLHQADFGIYSPEHLEVDLAFA